MKKYEVFITQTTTLAYVVKADSEERAERQALNLYANNADANRVLSEIEAVEVYEVEEAK